MPKEILEEWVKKSEGDFNTATREIKVTENPNYDAVCAHAQQCAEKYLKTFLIYHRTEYKRTHNLITLLENCLRIDPSLEFIRRECDSITGLEEFRYPSNFAINSDAKLALRSCKVIREKLGLRTTKVVKRKKH